MSAVVQVWVGELSKLREKVLASKPFLAKAKQGSEGEVAAEKEAKKKEIIKDVQRDTSGTMSEATVCLLMDRFVPW